MTAGFIGLFLIGQRFAELLHRYGYGAVAGGVLLENLGVPVPGEAMFMGAAALAQQGELHLPFVYLTGVLSAIAGDNLGFEVGRKFGRNVITRHFPRIFTEERLVKADRFFERRGQDEARFALGQYYAMLPIAVAGVVLLWRRRVTVIPLVAPFVLVTFTAASTFGITRYRVPSEVALTVLAGLGLAWVTSRDPVEE